MQTKISRADFAVLAQHSGLALSETELDGLHTAYGHIEAMTANIRLPSRGREPEPALTFNPEIR